MKIIGHSSQLEKLKTLSSQKRSPLSLLFHGPEGVGKKLSATHLIQSYFCEQKDGPCERCRSCLKVATHEHVDIHFISPEGKNIKIDQIRELKKQIIFRPTESSCRFVIIDQAECLNLASANALLKSLEEAPSHVVFILISSQISRLLKTILSRCLKFSFSSLSIQQLQEVYKLNNLKIPSQEILFLSEGSMSLSLQLQNNAFAYYQDRFIPIFNESKKNLLELFDLAQTLSQDKEAQKPFLFLLAQYFRQKLISQASEKHFNQFEKILKTQSALEKNANAQLSFENLFLELV